MLKLVIFDYDGLMVDSEQLAFIAKKRLFKRYGKFISKELFDSTLGIPVKDTLKMYTKHFSLDLSLELLIKEREKLVNDLVSKKLEPMPGLFELLSFLRSNHIRMAIATSGKKEYVMQGLEKLKIAMYFETIACVDEVKRGKPYPDLLNEVVRRVGVRKDECIMLEDALSGVEASINASIFCIVVPPKQLNINLYYDVDCIFNSLQEVNFF